MWELKTYDYTVHSHAHHIECMVPEVDKTLLLSFGLGVRDIPLRYFMDMLYNI